MSNPILVTGGTGRLGRALVPRLVSAGHSVRVLSRRSPSVEPTDHTWAVGDLQTGDGLDAALDGAGTIVHCATSNGRADAEVARKLTAAALRAGRPRLMLVSIVGVDRVDLPYYRAKLASEGILERSGLPWTIQRATQFHQFVDWMCSVQRWLPAILMPAGVSFQPVDVGEVADRLVSLAGSPPQGRAPDLGGPEAIPAVDLARAWAKARGRRRPVLPVPVAGAAFRGYRQGLHLAPGGVDGRVTFGEYLAAASVVKAGVRG